MRNLLEFLARYNHWFLFIILEVLSLVLLFRFNNYQGSVYFTSANAVAGQVYEWDSKVKGFFALAEINERLTERNLQLEQQLRVLSEHNAQRLAANDSGAVAAQMAKAMDGYRRIPAKVISNSLNKKENFITIDKGAADGVKEDMGVVCGNGIVGIVFMVSSHYSVVIPVLNSKSNISVAIDKRGYFGYLNWNGGETDVAYVEDVPRHARFKLTDNIVTSGYSAIFPPGVLVGKVLHVYNSADGLSYRIKVRLSTDFGNLRDVCVIDNSPEIERLRLMNAARDSIKSKQN